MNILIMGAAGSGKGTMSKLIAKKYGVVHISSGDMLRTAIKKDTPLGRMADKYISQGKLVPDDVVISIMEERLLEEDTVDGFLIDGFPRTLNQALSLESLMARVNKPLDLIINLVVGIDSLGPRITGRRICQNCGEVYHIVNSPSKIPGVCDVCGGRLIHREDDTLERLKRRLDEHHILTEPVLEYYHKLQIVVDIDASLSIEEVWHSIDIVLEKMV